MTALPVQTPREELANALSHGLGFLLATAALPLSVASAARHGSAASVVAASIFSATMIVLYLVSAVYHALPHGRAKGVFQRLDHAAIFLFIAGSYMPFVFGPLRGAWGWTLFGIVWTLAALGMVAKGFDRLRHPVLSTGLYVAMGWSALAAIGPLAQRLAPQGLGLLVAGGVAYTVGAIFFLIDHRVRFAHFAWHLAVMAGSGCHFLAALGCASAAPV